MGCSQNYEPLGSQSILLHLSIWDPNFGNYPCVWDSAFGVRASCTRLKGLRGFGCEGLALGSGVYYSVGDVQCRFGAYRLPRQEARANLDGQNRRL